MKKIYPNEWLVLHPYRQTNSVDLYYVNVANEIYEVPYHSELSSSFKEEVNLRFTSLCLAAWFEDVISQTGIWQAFTAECKRRYGSYLPFYPIGNDYFTDEINPEDVRFLMWHHIQYLHREECFINPENPGIEEAARMVYNVLDRHYEVAPENERLYNFLYLPPAEDREFYLYRKVLQWFHYSCYFNIENLQEYHVEVLKIADDKRIDTDETETLLYSISTSLMFRGRKSPLSLTSPEWIALLGKRKAGDEKAFDVQVRETGCYLLEKEDSDYLYLKDLYSEQQELFKVTKMSLNLSGIRNREVGKSILICELFKFKDVWWQIGMLIERKHDKEMAEFIKQQKAKAERTNEKAVYRDFMEASGGKTVVFCQSQEEIADFLFTKMGYKNREGVTMPYIAPGTTSILMASPYTGLHIQLKFGECLKSPDNPYYNKEEAEKNAGMFIINPQVIPYELSCILQDKGMLPDACINSSKGKQHGKKLLRENAAFLTDYIFYRCREKDLQDGEF